MREPDDRAPHNPLSDPFDRKQATAFKLLVRVDRRGCWIWRGGRRDGYAWFNGRPAHRASWEIHHGPIGPKLHILHGCNTKGCVNPAHIRPGTPKENAQDRARTTRRQAAKTKPEPPPRKLSYDEVPGALNALHETPLAPVKVELVLPRFVVYELMLRAGGDTVEQEIAQDAVWHACNRERVPPGTEEYVKDVWLKAFTSTKSRFKPPLCGSCGHRLDRHPPEYGSRSEGFGRRHPCKEAGCKCTSFTMVKPQKIAHREPRSGLRGKLRSD